MRFDKKLLTKYGTFALAAYLMGGVGTVYAGNLPPVADETITASNTAADPYTSVNITQDSANSKVGSTVIGINAGTTSPIEFFGASGATVSVSNNGSNDTITAATGATGINQTESNTVTTTDNLTITVLAQNGTRSGTGAVEVGADATGVSTNSKPIKMTLGNNTTLNVTTTGGNGYSSGGSVDTGVTSIGVSKYGNGTLDIGDNFKLNVKANGPTVDMVTPVSGTSNSSIYVVRTFGGVTNIGQNSIMNAEVNGGTILNNSLTSEVLQIYGIQTRNAGAVINVGDGVVFKGIINPKGSNPKDRFIARGIDVLNKGVINFLGGVKMEVDINTTAVGQKIEGHSLHAYSGGTVNVNQEGGHTVQLAGDLSADGAYASTTGGIVNLNLDTPDSYLQGNTVTGNGTMNISISNNAEMRPIYDNRYGTYYVASDPTTWDQKNKVTESTINANLVLTNEGKIDLSWDDLARTTDYRKLNITDLSGEGGRFIICTDLDSQVNGDYIHILNSTGGTQYIQVRDASSITGKDVTGERALLVATDDSGSLSFAGKTFNNGGLWETTPTLEQRGNDWYLVTLVKKFNSDVETIISGNEATYSLWRNIIMDDTLRKRLGDLRLSNEKEGVWARLVNGKLSGSAYNQRYATYQVGYDKTYGDTTYGVAIERVDSKVRHDKGTGDNTYTGLTLYATNYKPSGYYNDLVLKAGRMNHELNTNGDYPDSEDYGVNGYSVSYELGKTYTNNKDFYFEPQAQLALGNLGSVSYFTDRKSNFMVDKSWTFLGRLGFVLGRKIDEHNDYYFKANMYHDFAGKRDISFMASANQEHGFKNMDMGDTWYELGLGTNVKLARKTDFYGDITRSFGGDIKKDWQFNVGMRFAFQKQQH